MKTIINKYEAISLMLFEYPEELREDFRKALAELSDKEVATSLNLQVIRKGFFAQK